MIIIMAGPEGTRFNIVTTGWGFVGSKCRVQDLVSRAPVDIKWNNMGGNLTFHLTYTHFIPFEALRCPGHQILNRTFIFGFESSPVGIQILIYYHSVCDSWPNKGCLGQCTLVKGMYYSKYTCIR